MGTQLNIGSSAKLFLREEARKNWLKCSLREFVDYFLIYGERI